MNITVPLSYDEEGYLDRECPSPECESPLKVHGDDWRDKVSEKEVHCPFCGHVADDQQWYTRKQIEQARNRAAQIGLAKIQREVTRELKKIAANFNRRQSKNDFIQLRIDVSGGNHRIPVLRPIQSAGLMQQKVVCPQCSCRYAVVGAAFFCPACGHNAAEQMFGQTLEAIRNALTEIPNIERTLPDPDVAKNTVRLLIESLLQQIVTAFQRYVEVLYSSLENAPEARINTFQNLTAGSARWSEVTGKSYEDYLGQESLVDLNRYFQQRHLLAHRQGWVDQDYIKRSGDRRYQIGQRMVIRNSDIQRFVNLIEQLVTCMKADVQ